MGNARYPFRLNVGFLIHEEVGYNHDFSFEFQRVQLGDDLELGDLVGTLTIGRTSQGLLLTGDFSGHTMLECVRCLKLFQHKLNWSMTEHFALKEKSLSEAELLVPEDSQLDLQPLLREYALLEVPIKSLCRVDCPGLCPVCGQDLDIRDCGHRPTTESSPFSSLADLLKH